MNILYEKLPDSVTIDGISYKIITEFREWIRFADMVTSVELDDMEKIIYAMDWFLEERPEQYDKAFAALSEFYCMTKIQIPRKSKAKQKRQKPILSYEYDAPFLVASFMECYGIDLMKIERMHWWKFKSLLEGLNKDCILKERIGYRCIEPGKIKDKKERARIRRIQSQIALPHSEITDQEIANAFSGMM